MGAARGIERRTMRIDLLISWMRSGMIDLANVRGVRGWLAGSMDW